MLNDKQVFGTFSDVKENYQIKQIISIVFFFCDQTEASRSIT